MKEFQENMNFDETLKLLKQAFWRLQYRVRKQTNKEFYTLEDRPNVASENFESNIISKIYLKSIFDRIPSNKARYIIFRTIIQNATEKQVACELKISQQAVNKCKTKTLKELKMIL